METFELNSHDIEVISAKSARYGATLQWMSSHKDETLAVVKNICSEDELYKDRVQSLPENPKIGQILALVDRPKRPEFLETLFKKMVASESMIWSASQIHQRLEENVLWDSVEENENMIQSAISSDEILEYAVECMKKELADKIGQDLVDQISDLFHKVAKEMASDEDKKSES